MAIATVICDDYPFDFRIEKDFGESIFDVTVEDLLDLLWDEVWQFFFETLRETADVFCQQPCATFKDRPFEGIELLYKAAPDHMKREYGDVMIHIKDSGSGEEVEIPITDLYAEWLDQRSDGDDYIFGPDNVSVIFARLQGFVNCAEWHCGVMHQSGEVSELALGKNIAMAYDKADGSPILWYGPAGETPVKEWTITSGRLELPALLRDPWCGDEPNWELLLEGEEYELMCFVLCEVNPNPVSFQKVKDTCPIKLEMGSVSREAFLQLFGLLKE